MLFSWVPCYYIQTVEITEGKLGSQKETEILCVYVYLIQTDVFIFLLEKILKKIEIWMLLSMSKGMLFLRVGYADEMHFGLNIQSRVWCGFELLGWVKRRGNRIHEGLWWIKCFGLLAICWSILEAEKDFQYRVRSLAQEEHQSHWWFRAQSY